MTKTIPPMNEIRDTMRQWHLADDQLVISKLQSETKISEATRKSAQGQATHWVNAMRAKGHSGLMDIFMAEYGLSTEEGIALMCLAEALLRVPDAPTMDALIEDKIAPSDWGAHLGQSSSSLVNASTWALMLTGRVLDDRQSMAGTLHSAIKRLGEPVIRNAVRRAMRELGAQFVLGQTIEEAIENGAKMRAKGYTYSYDMLGEAARTAKDAQGFFESYAHAIEALAKVAKSENVRENPGISIKLSALFERYEFAQSARVHQKLTPRVLHLAKMARDANLGLNIDAEEAARLELSMDVIEAVLRDEALAGWDGFGIVVQAYGKRASHVINWFYTLSKSLHRKTMLRLVKGAYWDTEIKLAQVEGVAGFPVFTTKTATDISYTQNAAKLLSMRDVIYPQFATHNALSVAMVEALAGDHEGYEFQRLHGMGDGLYAEVMAEGRANCRIYAPVGVHQDLLAYLVRRLLENGANSSFVNQVLDEDVSVEEVVADPYAQWPDQPSHRLKAPSDLFLPRKNSRGWDLSNAEDVADIDAARRDFHTQSYGVRSLILGGAKEGAPELVLNPANLEPVGEVIFASKAEAETALSAADIWQADGQARADILRKAAEIYEENYGELFALLTKEAGKTPMDAIAELREAVDFLRYYAEGATTLTAPPRGVFVCLSPWNFPLAIFTGQIAAALGAGNAVIAKPAETTSVIAVRAVEFLHQAGVPHSALQLVLGRGSEVGAALTSSPLVAGVCFTGSTATAQSIHRAMAASMDAGAPLIAETGGLNAMIVDSTALPEQAVRDIITSAFQSAGQRCSACRVLYVQEDVADRVLEMLFGAMDALSLGDPWDFATDIGPVIDATAQKSINAHIMKADAKGRVLKTLRAPSKGHFVAPTVIELNSISELEREIFGPVLHVVRYKAKHLSKVIEDINATGYGLTFGMHSRIDDRVEMVTKSIHAGNIYVNRNQIGAIVGSQPFGGEGLSGTGPKAGGPLYLQRFAQEPENFTAPLALDLPGPTGESNQWSLHPRGVILCAGPSEADAQAQAEIARAQGCEVIIKTGLTAGDLTTHSPLGAVVYWGEDARPLRQALAARDGAITPLITTRHFASWCVLERHICIDTTSSGGNVELMAGEDESVAP